MSNINETVLRYLAAWNERDPKRRRELVAATWTEEGSYIDAHRHGHGHSAIDAMLAATQAQFPNYRLGGRRYCRGAALYRRHRFRNAGGGRPDQNGRRLHGRCARDVTCRYRHRRRRDKRYRSAWRRRTLRRCHVF